MTDHHDHGGNGGNGTMGVHGMLLFGTETLYLSHLPMFMRPHNFQVILEAGFDEAVREALDADTIHTFEPAEFPISELDPDGGGPARTTMLGTVYRGHFERGGTPVAEDVTAEVREVVHFAELDLDAQHSTDRDLRYLCFGRAGQLHLAHHVTANPDFDQVLTARLVPGTVTDPAGRQVSEDVTRDFLQAAPVEFRGRRDTPEDRLAAGETPAGFFSATVGPGGSHGFGVQLELGREVYLELGELGS
jgi:hypothetical protein